MNNNMTDIQESTIKYCITKGKQLEDRLQEITDTKSSDLYLSFDEKKELDDEETKIYAQMAKIKTTYDEAMNARETYDIFIEKANYHSEKGTMYRQKATTYGKKWGFTK